MKFSMNGFRKQLSGDMESLRSIAQLIVDGGDYDREDFADAVNAVITHSNVVNCVYYEGDKDFSDISDLEVDHVEIT